MSDIPQSWSVIIMCYNEEGNISDVIRKVDDFLTDITPEKCEIIIVDDSSSDNSLAEIKSTSTNARKIVKQHPTNLGIGEVLRTGYMTATNENIVAVPGDNQFDIDELKPFKTIPTNAVISFYRLENTNYNLRRNALSWINKTINKFALKVNLNDVNWVKVYKHEQLNKISLKITSSLVETEICSKLSVLGNHFIEVESKYLPRKHGKSKGASLRIVWMAFLDIAKLIYIILKFRLNQKIKNGEKKE